MIFIPHKTMMQDHNVKSLLIFRLGSVGDTVVALPGFRLIKKAFPNAKRFVLTNIPVNRKACALESVLQNTGLIDYYIEYPSKSLLLKKCLALRKIIQQYQFTNMIYFHQNRHLFQAWRDFLFFKLCGIKKIIGLPLFQHGFQYQYDQKTKLYESEHKRLVRQLKSLGAIDWSDPGLTDLALTTSELQYAKSVISDVMQNKLFIVFSVGAKLTMKDWGQKNWQKLISLLAPYYSIYGLIAIGVEDERNRSETLLQCWRGPILNLCGKLSVRESAAALQSAKLFIGHDSGPMHLAAAVGATCIAIFSRHAQPGCWFPLGAQHKIIYPARKSIQSIAVDEVAQIVFSVLPNLSNHDTKI